MGRKLNFALLAATRSLVISQCPQCGKNLPPAARFCPRCGQDARRRSQRRRNVPIAVQKIFPHQSIATSVVKNSEQ
ncbi:MAG: zinc ribbon domain-containing protein [Desulfobacterales bacterium]|nr:zinc ribbon domain-containing protein [Desulfobacterales bacterium]